MFAVVCDFYGWFENNTEHAQRVGVCYAIFFSVGSILRDIRSTLHKKLYKVIQLTWAEYCNDAMFHTADSAVDTR